MYGIIICSICLVLLFLWFRWEIKHAPTMPDDYDLKEHEREALNNYLENNKDNYNNPAL